MDDERYKLYAIGRKTDQSFRAGGSYRPERKQEYQVTIKIKKYLRELKLLLRGTCDLLSYMILCIQSRETVLELDRVTFLIFCHSSTSPAKNSFPGATAPFVPPPENTPMGTGA